MTDTISHRQTIKAATGIVFRLTPLESILKVQVTADTVTVLIESFTVTERKADVLVTGKAIKLYAIHQTPSGWLQAPPITMPEADFTPFAINNFGNGKSPSDWADGKKRERLAYRVGGGRAPLDNYERVLQCETTPRMNAHWNR